METARYRWTPASIDVPFLLGAIGAAEAPGPALVALLGGLGRQESAARNLLTRMRELGALESERSGRTTLFRLAPSSLPRYREIEGTGGPEPWAGSFAALIYAVPESQRMLRDRLQHQARSAGYGQLRSGVLIATGDRWDRLRIAAAEFEGEAWIHRVQLTPSSRAEALSLAHTAWNLAELDRAYRRALDSCARVEAVVQPGWPALRLWRELYDVFLAAQLQDPGLPPELLPRDWPAARFAAAQAEVNARIGRALQPWLRAVVAGADPAGLTVYYDSPWS
jgi:phenylacetic acid degradation operon negative regulatory protein